MNDSPAPTSTSPRAFTLQETCDYVADMSLQLSRLAAEAGAGDLSVLLTQVAHQAHDLAQQAARPADQGCCGPPRGTA